MNIKYKIKLMPLSLLFISNYVFSSGPPEIPFQTLFLEGEYTDIYPNSRIYANGRMQAEVDIYYQLSDGYTFVDADLKELYSGLSFANTVVSDGYNGYIKDVRLGPGTPAFTSLLGPSQTSLALTTQISRKYLSSSSLGIVQVCVEAQARNNSTNEIVTQSTCDNTTNNGSISIEKISPINFSLSNFTRSVYDRGFTEDWNIHAITYRPQEFTLRRVWDDNGIVISDEQLNRHGINYAPYRLLASYQPDPEQTPPFGDVNGSSSLYWISNAATHQLEFPYVDLYDYYPDLGGESYKKHSIGFAFNTNESITFVATYGGVLSAFLVPGGIFPTYSSRDVANMGFYYPGVTTPDFWMDIEPGGKRVNFEDNFGNRGYFSFARRDIGDYFGPGYYSLDVHTSR
ncbi:hypothetical protein [Microbulbifer discodermiae]|uniref:hypothetical protein n=1 Tax=Microbulbifer sp. 2201CG32-9 TaxID=3232309 RepID=UPI00345C2192